MIEYSGTIRLMQLLELERRQHQETKRKLEKAEHDRARYKRRIRYLDGRHAVLCSEFRALRKERDILTVALDACERSLMECQHGESKKMQRADSISRSGNITQRENCSASSALSTSVRDSLKSESGKFPEDGEI